MATQIQAPTADGTIDGISASINNDPLGLGCMACCSGGVDPTWGGVASASTVAL
jgi:hypothetical protein